MSTVTFEHAVRALVDRVGSAIHADLAAAPRGPDAQPTREAAQLVWVRRLPEIRATREYLDALRSLNHDPAFAHVANATTTSAVWSGAITGFQLLDGLLWRLVERGSLEGAEAEARRMAAAAQSPLLAVWIAPLFNVQVALDPLSISDSLKIARLDCDDLGRLERMGVLPSGSPYLRPTPGQLSAITATLEVPRHLGGEAVPLEEAAEFQRFSELALPAASGVLDALRLFKPQAVWIPGIVLWTEDPLLGHDFVTSTSGLFPGRTPTPMRMDYTLNPDECREFIDFYAACRTARGASRSVDLALRRFADASDRHRPEDELIDLMIASEALLLGGSETAELSFRAALRGAAFTTTEPRERREIFEHLRTAYNLRSKVVHGSTITAKDLKKAGVSHLAEFVSQTEGVLRAALRKAVLEAAATGSFEPDWDAMVLGLLDR